jgi:hypothetical protein
MYHDIERRQAVYELLALPDAPELRRGHRRLLEGRPDRFRLVSELTATFIQAKLLELQERSAHETA